MTATLTPTDQIPADQILTDQIVADQIPAETPVAETDPAEIGFGRTQLVSLTIGIVGVWALTTIIMGAYLDNYGAAAGLGAYLAFWIGGGTGFMAGGIRWGLAQEEH